MRLHDIIIALRIMTLFTSTYKKVENYLLGEDADVKSRRQLLCFFLLSFIELCSVVYNIMGWNGYCEMRLEVLAYVQLAFWLSVQTVAWSRRVSLQAIYALFLYIVYFRIVAEIVIGGHIACCYDVMYEVCSFTMLFTCSLFAAAARFRVLPFVLLALSTEGYLLVLIFDGHQTYWDAVWFLFWYFVLILVLSIVNYRRTSHRRMMANEVAETVSEPVVAGTEAEENAIKTEEEKALHMLGMQSNMSKSKAESLISHLSPEAQEKLLGNVAQAFYDDVFANISLEDVCPELSPSELEICLLVLKRKSMKEMCDILGKTVTNITSQRSRIRKKLGMKRDDDFRLFLFKRINEGVILNS